jgi:hypothetical protein
MTVGGGQAVLMAVCGGQAGGVLWRAALAKEGKWQIYLQDLRHVATLSISDLCFLFKSNIIDLFIQHLNTSARYSFQ